MMQTTIHDAARSARQPAHELPPPPPEEAFALLRKDGGTDHVTAPRLYELVTQGRVRSYVRAYSYAEGRWLYVGEIAAVAGAFTAAGADRPVDVRLVKESLTLGDYFGVALKGAIASIPVAVVLGVVLAAILSA